MLDEADHMADLGFLPAVKRLLDQTPAGTQRLLFSATLDNGIDVIVEALPQSNPVVHSVDPAVAPVSTMVHHVLSVVGRRQARDRPPARRRPAAVAAVHAHQARREEARQAARRSRASPLSSCTATCRRTLASATSQSFSDGSTRVLVATDIAARGIHVDEIGLVVHVDPPAEHKAYLHRSGRTARAGAEGVVVTLVTPDQAGDVRSLARAAGITPTVTAVGPGHARVVELAGDLAAHVAPSAAMLADTQDRPRHPRPQGRSSAGRPAGQSRGGQGHGGQSRSGGAGGQGRPGGQARSGQGRPGSRSRTRSA